MKHSILAKMPAQCVLSANVDLELVPAWLPITATVANTTIATITTAWVLDVPVMPATQLISVHAGAIL